MKLLRVLATSALVSCVLASLACSDDGTTSETSAESSDTGEDLVPACIDYELEGCALLYPPTYDQVWDQTLTKGCAEFGTACHAQSDAAGANNGMIFADAQQSWDHMLMDEAPVVVPGDPLCSELFVRLATEDPSFRMPPGSSGLSEGALCSIGTWIADGAPYQQP